MTERRRIGELERMVRKDLRSLPKDRKGRGTLEMIALRLARSIDARGDEGPTTTAKLLQELRLVMGQVMRIDGDDDDAAALAASLSTPVRNPAHAGAGDAGPGGDRAGAPAGPPVHGASGVHG